MGVDGSPLNNNGNGNNIHGKNIEALIKRVPLLIVRV